MYYIYDEYSYIKKDTATGVGIEKKHMSKRLCNKQRLSISIL